MPGFFIIDGIAHPVGLPPQALAAADHTIVATAGDHIWVHFEGRACELMWQHPLTHFAEVVGASGDNIARAPMPGAVITVSVSCGQTVVAGETLMVIESMKLETVIKAPRAGIVEAVHFTTGQTFERDSPLVSLVPEPAK